METPAKRAVKPTRAQISRTAAVFEWYLRSYHGRKSNLGTLSTFTDPRRVGAFAVSAHAIRLESPGALFKLLISVIPFQRRQDAQVLRILKGMSREDVRDLADLTGLLRRCDESPCRFLRSSEALNDNCDLYKDSRTGRGECRSHPNLSCHLKRHTVLLKRYGHFGKVPSSAALAVRETGAATITAFRKRLWETEHDPHRRAIALERALMRTWRVSRKIAAMYVSMLAVPGLSGARPVWTGLDSTRFVVIDSNTDQFLAAIGYAGPGTYDARLSFITALSDALAGDAQPHKKQPINPRLVQQAMYCFMGRINRRANPRDCVHLPRACNRCPSTLRELCPIARRTPARR